MRPNMESGDDRLTPRRRRGRGRALAIAATALSAALLLPYLIIDDEPRRLDEATRSATGGSFMPLTAGYTHYEASGPEDGGTVVFVPGTTVPFFVWDHNFHALADAGFRVIRYELYGRGLSDRPDARYDLDLYVEQLKELLAQVAPDEPVDLVGLSLGGMITTEFTRRYPERVRRLVLIGPGGVADPPLIARIVTGPVVGEYIMRVAGTQQLLPSRRMLLHPDRHARLDSLYLPTIEFQGSRRAVLETLRSVPYNGYQDAYGELAEHGKPVLLIWGRQDVVVPFSNSDRVRALVRPTSFVAVEDAGHLANYERPDVVNAALIEFFSK